MNKRSHGEIDEETTRIGVLSYDACSSQGHGESSERSDLHPQKMFSFSRTEEIYSNLSHLCVGPYEILKSNSTQKLFEP